MLSFKTKSLPLLNVLSDEELGELLKHAHVRNRNKNSVLFSDSLQRDHVYFVMSGWVGIFADSADGGQSIVDIVPAGGIVGDHLILENCSDDFYAMVISPEASLLEVNVQDVRNFAKKNSRFSYELFRFMSEQSLQMRKQICQINCMPAVDRILVFLLRFADGSEEKFLLPFTRTLMAAYLGMKRETFSRAQHELEKAGVIIKGNVVTIENYDRINQELISAARSHRTTTPMMINDNNSAVEDKFYRKVS